METHIYRFAVIFYDFSKSIRAVFAFQFFQSFVSDLKWPSVNEGISSETTWKRAILSRTRAPLFYYEQFSNIPIWLLYSSKEKFSSWWWSWIHSLFCICQLFLFCTLHFLEPSKYHPLAKHTTKYLFISEYVSYKKM